MTEQIVTYRGTVYPHQCDHMGHLKVMWYAASSMKPRGSCCRRTASHRREHDRPATTKRFRSLLRNLGRTAVPISGQEDAFADYGTVALVRT
jgi:hypothetical protein